MLISVIIPVYNGEKYLEKCVSSVLNQPYKNIEVICINDGSTDKSVEVLKEISERDERVHIINQVNEGVASARNKGIMSAKGEYVAFLDQDDIWVPNAVGENVIEKIKYDKYEMISFAYYQSNQSISRVLLHSREEKIIETDAEFPNEYVAENYRHHSSYFYLREFLLENCIMVDEYRNEDERFRMQCVYMSKKILYLETALFVYRNNYESVTHQQIEKKSQVIISCIEGYRKLFNCSENRRIVQYCNDSIVHLFLELMGAVSAESGKKNVIEEYYQKFELEKHLKKNQWMSEQDKKEWNLFFNHREIFIIKNKFRWNLYKLLRNLVCCSFLMQIYEKKKYPLLFGSEYK